MYALRGLLSVLARTAIAAIFVSAGVGKILEFDDVVANQMAGKGMPEPLAALLVGAIAFLLLGGISIVLGYKGRLGALLLLVFLGAATYYFHDFWNLPNGTPEEQQAWKMGLIGCLKNVALMGTMVFVIANGTGPWSLDGRRGTSAAEPKEPAPAPARQGR